MLLDNSAPQMRWRSSVYKPCRALLGLCIYCKIIAKHGPWCKDCLRRYCGVSAVVRAAVECQYAVGAVREQPLPLSLRDSYHTAGSRLITPLRFDPHPRSLPRAGEEALRPRVDLAEDALPLSPQATGGSGLLSSGQLGRCNAPQGCFVLYSATCPLCRPRAPTIKPAYVGFLLAATWAGVELGVSSSLHLLAPGCCGD